MTIEQNKTEKIKEVDLSEDAENKVYTGGEILSKGLPLDKRQGRAFLYLTDDNQVTFTTGKMYLKKGAKFVTTRLFVGPDIKIHMLFIVRELTKDLQGVEYYKVEGTPNLIDTDKAIIAKMKKTHGTVVKFITAAKNDPRVLDLIKTGDMKSFKSLNIAANEHISAGNNYWDSTHPIAKAFTLANNTKAISDNQKIATFALKLGSKIPSSANKKKIIHQALKDRKLDAQFVV